MQFFPRLFNQVEVVFRESAGVYDHFGQVRYVLFYCIPHFLYRDHVMAVVLVVHALCANCFGALLAKILYTFIWMEVAWDHLSYRLTVLIAHCQY